MDQGEWSVAEKLWQIRLMRKIKILLTKKGMNELHENMNHTTKSTIGLLKS